MIESRVSVLLRPSIPVLAGADMPPIEGPADGRLLDGAGADMMAESSRRTVLVLLDTAVTAETLS